MNTISYIDVLAAIGPASAILLHEAVRTKVSLSELREAVRIVRSGGADDLKTYDALECRMQRLVDLLAVASVETGPARRA